MAITSWFFKNQDFNKIKKECLESGDLFYDEFFELDVPGVMWLRPGKIVKDPEFFVGGASRFDVVQGENSDCWLLVAMANLTMNPIFFDHVVPKDQSFKDNYVGIFRFNIWQCGKWFEVVVDDRLPTKQEPSGSIVLKFTHSKEKNEFWSALLEKAYAKLYGSYNELTSGWFGEAMVDFTGGMVERLELNPVPQNLATIIGNSLSKSSFICVFMNDDPFVTELIQDNGLVKGHAYSLNKIQTVNVGDYSVCLVRLRNPWGKIEWKGPWSNSSPEWNSIPSDQKDEMGIVSEEDGEFWMPLANFIENFEYIDICHLTVEMFLHTNGKDQIGWDSHFFNGQWTKGITAGGLSSETFNLNPQYRIVLTDVDGDNLCTILIGLMQRNKSRQTWHQIGFTAFHLLGPEKDTNEPLSEQYIKDNFQNSISCAFLNYRERVVRDTWEPGVYCIIPSTYAPGEEGQFLLRVFSEKEASVDESTVAPKIVKEHIDQNEPMKENFHVGDSQNREEQRGDSQDLHLSRRTTILLRNEQEITEYFQKVAESENEIGWEGLQSILVYAISKSQPSDTASSEGFFEKISSWLISLFYGSSENKLFTKDECRSLISILDVDRSGRLSLKEFQILWRNLQRWERVFLKYSDSSSYMHATELSSALQEAGFKVKASSLSRLVRIYSTKDGKLEFDDFVMCLVELMTGKS